MSTPFFFEPPQVNRTGGMMSFLGGSASMPTMGSDLLAELLPIFYSFEVVS